MTSLDESYVYCRKVARSRAKNFYYSFLLLEKQQRDAMCAIYAFMRYCDDLSDDVGGGSTLETMEKWRKDMVAALAGQCDNHVIWPAFRDAVERYRIPHEYFHHMIDGVSSDLVPRNVETFDELYRYCYQVASVVGLTIIHIFGFEDPNALLLAEKCGVAFQLTNIIRDVREDWELGRRYIPAEDLIRFGADPLHFGATDEWFRTLAFEGMRARVYYDESRPLIGMVHHKSRRSLWALVEIYSRLLKRIDDFGFNVFHARLRLTMPEKILILGKSFLRIH